MRNEFSVCQFFTDGSHEYVRRFVSSDEAMKAVRHHTQSVAANMGIVKRVIVTDGGDCLCFEWTSTDGIIFPPQNEQQKEMK